MVDTDFEKDSRAHSFWQDWQNAADLAGDVTNEETQNNQDCCINNNGWEHLVWVNNIKKYA